MAESTPQILFLVHRAPWPPDRGDRIRSWHMFEALRQLGAVHVAALVDSADDLAVARAKMAPLCASLSLHIRSRSAVAATLTALVKQRPASVEIFGHDGLARYVDGLINHGTISHIVAFSSQMAQYLPDPERFSGPVVMDFVDVDSAKFAAYAANDRPGPMRWVHAREARMLAAWEAQVAARVSASLFVSEAEKALFRAHCSAGNVHAIGNGIDLDRFSPDGDWLAIPDDHLPAGPLAVFTGQMDYRPNIEAVTHFARATLPLLQRVHPDAHFAIVGRAPTDEVRALASIPGVIVTGEVPDTRPWLAAAQAVVAPLKVARGVQNKLLEAMAMARPVVASPDAAQGIDAEPGLHLLIAGAPREEAECVAALMTDPARGRAMGQAARMRMAERYGWAAALSPLGDMLQITSGPR